MKLTRIINYVEHLSSRLKYWIDSSALVIHWIEGQQCLHFGVLNSRGTETPGHISLPASALPKLIAELIELQNELILAGKIQT